MLSKVNGINELNSSNLQSKCPEKYTYKSKIRTVKLSTFKKGGVVDVEIRSSLLGRDIHACTNVTTTISTV